MCLGQQRCGHALFTKHGHPQAGDGALPLPAACGDTVQAGVAGSGSPALMVTELLTPEQEQQS